MTFIGEEKLDAMILKKCEHQKLGFILDFILKILVFSTNVKWSEKVRTFPICKQLYYVQILAI